MNWISVKDQLPEVYETILMWGIATGDDLCTSCRSNQEKSDSICAVYYGYIDEDELFRCDFNLDIIKVTHWMPIPDEPE